MRKTAIALGSVALLSVSMAAPAMAGPDKAKPDTSCMQAGIAALKTLPAPEGAPGKSAFPSVAKNGLKVSDAVALGVGVRDELPEGVGLDTVLKFSDILADHRAGENSVFTYPWCEA